MNTTSIHNGIVEQPRYRISGGEDLRDMGQGWWPPNAGGPFGYLNVATSRAEVPADLRNDGGTDRGSLYEVHPYEPDALPASAATSTRLEEHCAGGDLAHRRPRSTCPVTPRPPTIVAIFSPDRDDRRGPLHLLGHT